MFAFIFQIYFGLINLFSTVPILLAAMIYFSEFLKYCTEEEPAGLQLWQVGVHIRLWDILTLWSQMAWC